MDGKRFKLMAYILSTGLWDGYGCVSLEQVLAVRDAALEADLKAWQSDYDEQFMRCPHQFDWSAFNTRGQDLADRIQAKLPAGSSIHYEPSDDRDFFSTDQLHPENGPRFGEMSLRERKRVLLYMTHHSMASSAVKNEETHGQN